MHYSHKLVVVTALSLILAACGGGSSDSKSSAGSTGSNVFNETRYNFDFKEDFSPTSAVLGEPPPYDINRYSGRVDSNNVVLRTNYTNVVGRAYTPESRESYILTEKRLLITPISAASEATTGYKDSILISETANSVTLAPYNVGLHKDTATYTLEFNQEILDGKLIADVVTNNSFDVEAYDPHLLALINSGLRFPAGSNALVSTTRSNSEDFLEFKYESSYDSISELKALCDYVTGQFLCAILGGVSFKDFVWLGNNFACITSGLLANTCTVNYNNKVYEGRYNAKGSGDWANDEDLSKRYSGFNKTAADALESALKIHFARKTNTNPL
jgi:hypothetical protein